jgi:RNA polymerase sigma factor (sigma-70 family)
VKEPAAVRDPRSDDRLVRACIRGDEEAWAALVEKYKNLVYSIPVKQGFAPQDAADIFQRVCLLLLAELPRLREPQALPAWLIRVTSRECWRWLEQERRFVQDDDSHPHGVTVGRSEEPPEPLVADAIDEQRLRAALGSLPARCRRLIEMLFFESPTRPYREVAKSLGLATGSIGFIRGRCLARLRRQLERMGFG